MLMFFHSFLLCSRAPCWFAWPSVSVVATCSLLNSAEVVVLFAPLQCCVVFCCLFSTRSFCAGCLCLRKIGSDVLLRMVFYALPCCIPVLYGYVVFLVHGLIWCFPVPRCVSRAFCSAFLRLATISLPLCSFAWNMYCGSTKRQKHMLFVFSSRWTLFASLCSSMCAAWGGIMIILCLMCSLAYSAGETFCNISPLVFFVKLDFLSTGSLTFHKLKSLTSAARLLPGRGSFERPFCKGGCCSVSPPLICRHYIGITVHNSFIFFLFLWHVLFCAVSTYLPCVPFSLVLLSGTASCCAVRPLLCFSEIPCLLNGS